MSTHLESLTRQANRYGPELVLETAAQLHVPPEDLKALSSWIMAEAPTRMELERGQRHKPWTTWYQALSVRVKARLTATAEPKTPIIHWEASSGSRDVGPQLAEVLGS